jgi:hypothetical protein
MRVSIERAGVAGIACFVPTLVAGQALGTILAASSDGLRASAIWGAVVMALLALVQGLLLVRGTPGGGVLRLVACLVGAGAVYLAWESWSDAAAILVATTVQGLGTGCFAKRLPVSLDGAFGRTPWKATAWTLLALLAVFEVGQLSAFSTDIESGWYLTTDDEWWSHHMCMSAYVYAAELHERGEENIYGFRHYPGASQEAKPESDVGHLQRFIEDPYQYPPPFLLLPLGGLSLTNDFFVIRSVWFAVHVLLLGGITAVLARWVGGERGRAALWALPAAVASVPLLNTLAYGQVHILMVLIAVLAMVCLDRGRVVLGGGLLATAILAKIFPALLLLPLIARGAWRSVVSCLAWCVGLSCVAWVVLGNTPFVAFVSYALPRIASGEAFDFESVWPEFGHDLLVMNLSVTRVGTKLAELGVIGSHEGLTTWLPRVFAVLLVLGAFFGARRRRSRGSRVLFWLGLLAVAPIQGGAGFDYVVAPSLWMLAFAAVEMKRGLGRRVVLSICWIPLVLLLGTQPMPDRIPAPWDLIGGLAQTIIMVGLSAWAVLGRGGGDEERCAPQPAEQ